MHLFSKCTEIRAFICALVMIISFIHNTTFLLMSHFSFSLAVVLFIPVYMKMLV